MGTRTAIALWTMAGLLLTLPAQAQDPAQLAKVPPSVRAGIQTDYLAEHLHLSPQERAQVEAINLDFANRMQPVLEGSSGMFARMREAGRVEEAKDDAMRKVLSPEQYQAYLAAKPELKDRLKRKALEGGAGAS